MDLDADGRTDILSGSYSPRGQGIAGLFQILRGKDDGTFHKAAVLNGNDGEPLIIPSKGKPGEGEDWVESICTRPFAVDWNGDGHLDLVVGNSPGSFFLFKGLGKGQFEPVPEKMMAGDQPLKSQGEDGDPFVIDWDSDGDLDILSGSSVGGVQWAENRAGPGAPARLEPFRWVIKPDSLLQNLSRPENFSRPEILRDADLEGPQTSTRLWVDDINGDGKLDLLVGDLTVLASPVGNMTEDEFNERYQTWRNELAAAAKEYHEADSRFRDLGGYKRPRDKEIIAITMRRSAAHWKHQVKYEEKQEFLKEDRTGFIWLYLRK